MRRNQRNQNGALLIEQIIALGLIGLALTALLLGLSAGVVTGNRGEQLETAGQIASSALERIKAGPYLTSTLTYPLDPNPRPGYTLSNQVTTLRPHLQQITVTVHSNNQLLLELSGYKANR